MAVKAFTVRLDEKEVQKLNYYCSVTGKNKTDFIADAIENEIKNIKLQRSGGMVLRIPNPEIANMMTESEKEIILNELTEVGEDVPSRIKVIKSNLGLGLIAKFLKSRFNESKEYKETLKDNFHQDIMFENNIYDEL